MHIILHDRVPINLIQKILQRVPYGTIGDTANKHLTHQYVWHHLYDTTKVNRSYPSNLGLIMNVPHIDVDDDLKRLLIDCAMEVFDGANITTRNKFRITRYEQGMLCAPHRDDDEDVRNFGLLFLLTDDFEGGVFHINDTPIQLHLGDVLIFNISEIHSVTTVTAGTRLAAFDFFGVTF